ncbi:LLM class flavin-dependent oxidoreductase [Microbacterium sp. 18062]|uniref:LLM class flavin-dependent oxidoreductase n=1 Tax=Microbacterium sp. 18062 TaxID=2681410 RepID=UPI00135BE3BC|nr:LLM class flavin-dependent oxidoreductase [Microbacterium sp. 18062]
MTSATAATVPAAGFILPGNYPEDDPAAGLEATLRLFAYGEELGFDVAGIRQRHLERGVSSALPLLAAAGQRTSRILLETDVVPLGYETPFRLAEDFATVDALSGRRVNIGVSTSAPHATLLSELGRPDHDPDADPFTLIERFLLALEGHPLASEPIHTPYGPQIPRVQPHVAGLRDRVWLGGGSLRSVLWAAERGLKLLLGNVGDGDAADTFEQAQRIHIEEYHAGFAGTGAAEVGVERVLLPTDSATPRQREHYAAFAAARDPRTERPQRLGDRAVVFQRDLHGTSAQIAERLAADPTFDGRTELRVALPYGFSEDEYRQILSDIRHGVLPALGWSPVLAGAA